MSDTSIPHVRTLDTFPMIDLKEFLTLPPAAQRAAVALQMVHLARTVLLFDRHSRMPCTTDEARLLYKLHLLTSPDNRNKGAATKELWSHRASILRRGVSDSLLSTSLRLGGKHAYLVLGTSASLHRAHDLALKYAAEIRTERFDTINPACEHVDLMRSVLAEVDAMRTLRRAVHDRVFRAPSQGELKVIKSRLKAIGKMRARLHCFGSLTTRVASAVRAERTAYVASRRHAYDPEAQSMYRVVQRQMQLTKRAAAAFRSTVTTYTSRCVAQSAPIARREAQERNTFAEQVQVRMAEREALELRERRVLLGYFPAEYARFELTAPMLMPDPLPDGVAPLDMAEDAYNTTVGDERYIRDASGAVLADRMTDTETPDGALVIPMDPMDPLPSLGSAPLVMPVPMPQDYFDVLSTARDRFSTVMRGA
jgi:hypothetical protein